MEIESANLVEPTNPINPINPTNPTNLTDLTDHVEPAKRARPQIEVFVLEGSIAVGKSTTLNDVVANCTHPKSSQRTHVISIQEPVDEWTAQIVSGERVIPSLLSQLYDQTCAPIGFQLMALLQRFGMLMTAIEEARAIRDRDAHTEFDKIMIIAERSCVGDMIFASVNITQPTDWYMYTTAHRRVREALSALSDISFVLCYLHLDVPTIVDRIRYRGREAERSMIDGGVANPYLTALTQAHVEALYNIEATSSKVFEPITQWLKQLIQNGKMRCITVDASRTIQEVSQTIMNTVHKK